MKYSDFIKFKNTKEYTEIFENYTHLSFAYFSKYGDEIKMIKFLDKGFKFIETYKGNDIYEKNGCFLPYVFCSYYFETLEYCKNRIDIKGIAYVPFNCLTK